MTLYVPLSPAQRFWYLRLLNRSDSVTISEIFQDVKEEENILSTREGSEEDGDQVIKANVRSAIEAGKSATAGNNEWSKMMNL